MIEETQPENSCYPSMDLEYDLSEEFKGDIKKVPEKGSVENLTLKKKTKKLVNDRYDFWEDPLGKVQQTKTHNELWKETTERDGSCTLDSDGEPHTSGNMLNAASTGFVPITEESCSLTDDAIFCDNDVIGEELSHSPALDTPLTTFYRLVPDSDSEGQEKTANRNLERPQRHSPKTIPCSPPSPTSTEVRSILENYVVDQMLIKNSAQHNVQDHLSKIDGANEEQQSHLYTFEGDVTTDGLVPPLKPQKTCVSGTAQISATSPKRVKLSTRPHRNALTSPSRKCLSEAGDNRSDTQSEDSFGSSKTDPLHYFKTPRRGLRPCHASSGSLPREYKVIIRDKTACVHYVGCEVDTDKNISGAESAGVQRRPRKTALVQLR